MASDDNINLSYFLKFAMECPVASQLVAFIYVHQSNFSTNQQNLLSSRTLKLMTSLVGVWTSISKSQN